jgi:hypothetical protein
MYTVVLWNFYPHIKGGTKKIEVDEREKKRDYLYRELVETFSLLYFKSLFELHSRHIFYFFHRKSIFINLGSSLISTTKGYRRETDPFDCVRMNTPANGLITSWIIVHTFTKYFEQESYQ